MSEKVPIFILEISHLGVVSEPEMGGLFGQKLEVLNSQSLDGFPWVVFQVLKKKLQLYCEEEI